MDWPQPVARLASVKPGAPIPTTPQNLLLRTSFAERLKIQRAIEEPMASNPANNMHAYSYRTGLHNQLH